MKVMKKLPRVTLLFGIALVVATLTSCNFFGDPEQFRPQLPGSISVSPSSADAGAELSAVYSGSEIVSYQWKKDGETVGTDSSKCRAIKPGTYTVTINAPGYKGKSSAPVTVNPIDVNIPAFIAQLNALGDTTIDKPATVQLAGGSISNVLKEMDDAITAAGKDIILDLFYCYADGDSIVGSGYPADIKEQHMNRVSAYKLFYPSRRLIFWGGYEKGED